MAVVNTEPKFSKRRKLGKNKKKSWRTSNIDDVEEFLADERRQIRTGGIVAEKSDESLFVLDKGKEETIHRDKTESKTKRRLKDKPLKCLALLQPNPLVKPVRKPEQEDFQKGKRTQRVLERLRARSESAVRVAAVEQRKRDVAKRDEEKKRKRKLPEADSDIWADDNDGGACVNVKRPKGLSRKPSALKATVIPHPGASVNPAYEDHQDLLLQAHKTELIKEKKAKQIYNALDAMFPSKEQQRINQVLHMKEMAAGLYDDSEDEDSEEDNSDDDEEAQTSFSVGAPVRREDKKTKKQKRVALTEKNQTKERKTVNDLKKRQNMVLRIPSLKSEINKAERKTKQRVAERQKKKAQQKFKTKRLNSVKFEEPDQDLKLSTELVASLREIKPEGHLMNDVYKSLQRRNIIEPRIRQKKNRKYRPKVFEKKGHKAVTL